MQLLSFLWSFATAWYNLPFTLSLLVCVLLGALQFIGLGQDHDADVHVDVGHDMDLGHDMELSHDVDMGHDMDLGHDVALDHDIHLDHDVHVDHDLGHDLDHGVDHDVEHDVGHDAEHDMTHGGSNGGAAPALNVLRFLGVGQVPITMVLLVLLGGFGIIGWMLNAVVLGITPQYPAIALLFVGLAGLAFAAWFTSRTARALGRAVPAFASTATTLARLVGRRGRVASPEVDEKYGQVKVRDLGGTLITVFAVVDAGKPHLKRDTEVILVEYDPAHKVFVVVPSDM